MIRVTLINKDQRATYECRHYSFFEDGKILKLRLRSGVVFVTVKRWDRIEISDEVEDA